MAFGDVGHDDARGVEAARIVDHDGDFADLADVVEGPGERRRRGVAAEDDLDQLHLVDGREEVDADEAVGAVMDSASPVIGKVEVLEARMAPGCELAFGPRQDLGLQVAVLEHRFDDEVARLQPVVVDGGVMRSSTDCLSAAVARPLSISRSMSFAACALPRSALSMSRSMSTTSMPARAET
jgi:hypothetical protein